MILKTQRPGGHPDAYLGDLQRKPGFPIILNCQVWLTGQGHCPGNKPNWYSCFCLFTLLGLGFNSNPRHFGSKQAE